MISIESWRCSIGCHNIFTGFHAFKQANPSNDGIATVAIILEKSVGMPFSLKLIAIMLLIGCVESNPGPKQGSCEGKNSSFSKKTLNYKPKNK